MLRFHAMKSFSYTDLNFVKQISSIVNNYAFDILVRHNAFLTRVPPCAQNRMGALSATASADRCNASLSWWLESKTFRFNSSTLYVKTL